MSLPTPHILKVAQTKADKAEKTRQSTASLQITYIYQYILAGIIGLFLLRNLAVLLRDYLRVRRRSLLTKADGSSEKGEKGNDLTSTHESDSVIFKAIGAVDRAASKPVGLWPLPPNCTILRLGLSTLICAVNLTFCLIIDTHLLHPATVNSNIPRAFVRRCGRIAVANFPILFALVGRNNPVTLLTGFGYQEVRFYHRLIGGIVSLEVFVHTIGYVGYYVQFLGAEALHEEYTELYFKMGIVAQVGLLMLSLFAFRALRSHFYEVMLILHVLGAAMLLAGSWYHRPIIVNWVYAAVAIWAFERLARFTRHVFAVFHARFFLRTPILRAEATVVSGAILLRVPFPVGKWEASQHAFISFWGTDLLSKPWLYGQSHPFSICNIPRPAPHDDHELRFVLRIKKGITRTLANHILAGQKDGEPASKMVRISAEGPYGHAAADNDFESVLLVAGGSGITHVSSALADVVQKVADGKNFARSVKLVWAVHHFNQTHWLGPILSDVRSTADKTQLDLQIHIYVTRPSSPDDSSINGDSGRSSPTAGTGSFSDEEKKINLTEAGESEGSRLTVHVGRPDVADIVSQTISQSTGRVRIVACGPDAILDTVRLTTSAISSAAVDVEIASFEC